MAPQSAADLQLSIVIPALDEERSVGAVVTAHAALAREIAPRFEIIVCDDGSTDGTWAVLTSLARVLPELRLVRHATNRRIPATMKELYGEARGTWTYFTPADGQVPPDALRLMWAARGESSAVVGRRFPRRDPMVRTVMARAYASLVATLFRLDVHDVDGVKLYRTADRRVHAAQSTSVFFEAEQLIRLSRFARGIVEVTVPHLPRTTGHPKAVTFDSTLAALRDVVSFAWQVYTGAAAAQAARLRPQQ